MVYFTENYNNHPSCIFGPGMMYLKKGAAAAALSNSIPELLIFHQVVPAAVRGPITILPSQLTISLSKSDILLTS